MTDEMTGDLSQTTPPKKPGNERGEQTMTAWIFQANPSRYDVAGFGQRRPLAVSWLVSRYRTEILVGDRVFLWASGGDPQVESGVFGSGVIASAVQERPDDGPPELWRSPEDRTKVAPRVRVSIDRIAQARQVIQRKWLAADPAFAKELIIRMPNHTTFKVEGGALERLEHLWSRTGANWTYPETLAGLWAYSATRQRPLSKTSGPIVEAAMLVGRPIPGMYNKVMNFRAIDPRDARAGLSSSSTQDKKTWDNFSSPDGVLDQVAVTAEFERLFHPLLTSDATGGFDAYVMTSELTAKTHSLADLLAAYASRPYVPRPRAQRNAGTYIPRDTLVAAIARKRADFRCEVPGCAIPTFADERGVPYVEVHHLERLADGGPDVPENVACVCAQHHREIHLGSKADVLTAKLRALRFAEAGKSQLPG